MMLALARVVQTCCACPSQWDAWTTDGQYLYMRYRFGCGTVDAYASPDEEAWNEVPDGRIAKFCDPDEPMRGDIELDEFLRRADLVLADGAEVAA